MLQVLELLAELLELLLYLTNPRLLFLTLGALLGHLVFVLR